MTLKSSLEGDSMIILPNGYGKSLIFQLLPRICESQIIIITPFSAIIQEQVLKLGKRAKRIDGDIINFLSNKDINYILYGRLKSMYYFQFNILILVKLYIMITDLFQPIYQNVPVQIQDYLWKEMQHIYFPTPNTSLTNMSAEFWREVPGKMCHILLLMKHISLCNGVGTFAPTSSNLPNLDSFFHPLISPQWPLPLWSACNKKFLKYCVWKNTVRYQLTLTDKM